MIAIALPRNHVKCLGINMFLADGEAARPEVFHLHVFPRYHGARSGFLWSSSISHVPERDELGSVAENIKKALRGNNR